MKKKLLDTFINIDKKLNPLLCAFMDGDKIKLTKKEYQKFVEQTKNFTEYKNRMISIYHKK